MRATRKPRTAHCTTRVAILDRLRWSLADACALVDLSPNYLRELERKHQFPPRVVVRNPQNDESGKEQFIASEVRAWADGRDWRAMVAARLQVIADAS